MQTSNNEYRIKELESLLPQYTNHLNNLREFYGQLESFIRIFNEREINSTELYELKQHLEISGFLSICLMDLLVTSKNLMQAKEVWEEIYYLRHSYLTIYEALNAYVAFTKWINEMMNTKYQPLKPKFIQVSESIRKFKKDFSYQETIADIRNETLAHISIDFRNYFHKISSFDRSKAVVALLEFIIILISIHTLLNEMGVFSYELAVQKSNKLNLYVQDQFRKINQQFNALNQSLNLKN
ncbi:MAG: hypothetical protein ACJ748_17110 [Flavisolibacter sp.]